jgi:hypothetical protein
MSLFKNYFDNKEMVFDLLDSTVQVADGTGLTITTANQTLATTTIPESRSYKYVLYNATLEIAMVASPVVQQIDFELLNDAVVVKTFNFSPGAIDVIGITTYHISFPVQKNNSGTLILQLGNAPAVDVDVTIKVKDIWCAGVS